MKPKLLITAILVFIFAFLAVACTGTDSKDTDLERLEEESQELDSDITPETNKEMPVAEMASVNAEGVIRQWASSAKASSSYSDPGWSAVQAVGSPDVSICADDERAWASLRPNGIDWLELNYDTPVVPTEINIYQTYNPSQVVEVHLTDVTGKSYFAWAGDPEKVDQCPLITRITLDLNDGVYFNRVTVFVDQSKLNLGWAEIDAVELVGMLPGFVNTTGQASTLPTPVADENEQVVLVPPLDSTTDETTPSEPVSTIEPDTYLLPTSNPEKPAYYSLKFSAKYQDGRTKDVGDSDSGDNIEVSVHPDRIDIRFKGELGRYLLLTLPPTLPDNFNAQLGTFSLSGRGPTSAGIYIRSVWYYSQNQGTINTRFNPDGTLSGELEFTGIREGVGDTVDVQLSFEHVPLD